MAKVQMQNGLVPRGRGEAAISDLLDLPGGLDHPALQLHEGLRSSRQANTNRVRILNATERRRWRSEKTQKGHARRSEIRGHSQLGWLRPPWYGVGDGSSRTLAAKPSRVEEEREGRACGGDAAGLGGDGGGGRRAAVAMRPGGMADG
ncbi:hypothetical protein GUJ93_ZPchr0002g24664 [Zizania palustris]|uniref:Uncharacterized protein n=1 Tax=Zizania palustris TaxID=103762 RepID=A0A8J5S5T2_ZIZPA|nr:hypothetical protein GUJ93_ZPchr0002g24664 [Zizania palustris]